jgi:4-amino-4-deoxy-L-arabinose transferase-like glycosyltransferase
MASRRSAYALVALACILPRLALLLYQRGGIWNYDEKSDIFALTFVHSGTFGFIPGQASAYTQPLYGFFLVPVFWIFGRHWWALGAAQIAVAMLTAWVVYEIGRQVVSRRVGVIAALVATLHPYLVWHDVHVNREILDQLLGALAVLLAIVAVERRSLRLAGLLGVVAGLAILANTRLAFLPIVLAAYVAWRLRRTRIVALAAVAIVAGAAVAVAPWVVRNRIELGCYALTTDSKALWKANNPQTYELIASGQWIDGAKDPPGAPLTPFAAFQRWAYGAHPVIHVDECAFEAYWQHRVVQFWKHHPGEKLKLAGQATALLWDPRDTAFQGNEGAGGNLDHLRTVAEGTFMGVVFALGIAGLLLVRRWFASLALLLFAYETAAAAVFAGQTRYRVAWDFLAALLAATALARLRPRSR